MALTKIPSPPRQPIIGNLPQLYGSNTIQKLVKLADDFDGIYSVKLPGATFYVVTKYELVDEICNEKKFRKVVSGVLGELRNVVGDALFTAQTHEPNWQKAHNILMPGFGMPAMKSYISTMNKVSQELVDKWSQRQGEPIDVSEDMTRLTLETIGRCGFDYSFHSFNRDELDPFVYAMSRCLEESLERVKRTSLQKAISFAKNRQFKEDIEILYRTVDDVIRSRMQNPKKYEGKQDFLSLMLNGIDKKTGEKLDEKNIRFQLLTFLIAGHETTSGLLSFAIYFLLSNPEILEKTYLEIDNVLGPDTDFSPDFKTVSQLSYCRQVLQESLRIWPTAPAFTLAPYEDYVLNGKYLIKKDERCAILPKVLHQEKSIWGDDVAIFNPDHFSAINQKKLPKNAFKPFGHGSRICIGQHFALTEATIALVTILKNFEITKDPSYKLRILETITLKPEGLYITVKKRSHQLYQKI